MHELFLTAVVPDSELERAQALLQGLSGMTAYARVQRVLYFAGPPQPKGLTVRRSVPTPLQPAQARLWTELHQQLSRQSFVVQVRYGVTREAFGGVNSDAADATGSGSGSGSGNGNGNALARLNSTPGTLRWMDIPDPTPGGGAAGNNAYGSNRLVMQRKITELPDSRNLPAVLQDNNYGFKSELVEESLAFFDNDTEYSLVRYHRLPPAPATGPGAPPVPLAALPPWADVVAPAGGTAVVDPAGQWLFFVRRYVLDDTSPDKMAQALDALEAVRAQLAGAFVFRPADRRAHDTRIERPSSSSTMPAPLPQRVRT